MCMFGGPQVLSSIIIVCAEINVVFLDMRSKEQVPLRRVFTRAPFHQNFMLQIKTPKKIQKFWFLLKERTILPHKRFLGGELIPTYFKVLYIFF